MAWRIDALTAVLVAFACSPAAAQDEPPRIGPIVLDVRGSVPRFPRIQPLADSRGISVAELPGMGLGGQLGMHLYLVKWQVITIGIGGEVIVSRARQTPSSETAGLQAVTETFRSLGTQLSLNFGNGNGWSYLSGGIGRSNWSIVPDLQGRMEGDDEVLKTINYGGGARWFAKRHLAFTFDVRFYALNPGTGSLGRPGSPRTTFMVIAAGISLKP
jgi:hypothetical protein